MGLIIIPTVRDLELLVTTSTYNRRLDTIKLIAATVVTDKHSIKRTGCFKTMGKVEQSIDIE